MCGRLCALDCACGRLLANFLFTMHHDTQEAGLGYKEAKLIEEGFRDPLVMGEGGFTCLVRNVAFSSMLGGGGGADLGKGGCDVGRCVMEGCAGVADGDAYKFNATPI